MNDEHPRCFAHFLRNDGTVAHCLGPADHWGDHTTSVWAVPVTPPADNQEQQ